MTDVSPALEAQEGKATKPADEGRKNIVKAFLLAGVLVAALAVVHYSPLGHYFHVSQVDALKLRLARFQEWAPAVFFLAGALIIALGAPRSIIGILGGMLFGFSSGTILGLGAAVLGSAPIFYLTKWLGRPLFKQKVGVYLETVEEQIRAHGFWVVALLRQLPITCFMANVLIGLTSVSSGTFFLGSIVGLLPESVIFALFGSSVREAFVLRASLASFLLILLSLAITISVRKSAWATKLSWHKTKM